MMTYRDLLQSLSAVYEPGEAKAIARMVLEKRFHLSMADILIGKDTQLSADDQTELEKISQRLSRGEPVQYVLGMAEFGPHTFTVSPKVLIPRPETYKLCQWISESCIIDSPTILDIGTGSGCIAITLARQDKSATVEGWDISADALAVARQNAGQQQVHIALSQHDIFTIPNDTTFGLWDIIVSNPPYVCRQEAGSMAPWVLNHEPHTALFVPDDDPLLFYRRIGYYAKAALNSGGMLFFEVNPLYHVETAHLLEGLGFHDIKEKTDQFGKQRFIRACK